MKEATTVRDAVFLYALKATASKLLQRFKRALRGKIKRGHKYPFRFEIKAIANGKAVSDKFAGQVWQDADGNQSQSPGSAKLVGAVLQVADDPRLAAKAKKFDLKKLRPGYEEMAEAVIDAHRSDKPRAGEVHVDLEA